eukprot:3763581-Amphidinium_carterae.1
MAARTSAPQAVTMLTVRAQTPLLLNAEIMFRVPCKRLGPQSMHGGHVTASLPGSYLVMERLSGAARVSPFASSPWSARFIRLGPGKGRRER